MPSFKSLKEAGRYGDKHCFTPNIKRTTQGNWNVKDQWDEENLTNTIRRVKMKKLMIEFEGNVQDGTLKIPVLDLFVNDIVQKAKKEVFDDLKRLFPKTLQPLGTKRETMIPKWKAIKNIGILIDKLENQHKKD